jgi:prophage tail gpP-like protein
VALKEDRVALTLGEETISITESYEVRASVLTQPAAFSINLGHGGVALELMQKYPPKTKFKLTVNDIVVQTGLVDGVSSDDNSGATTVNFRGRDMLARLYDAFLPSEESFQEATYTDLVRKHLDAVGLKSAKITASNEANRKAITGSKVVELAPSEIEADLRIDADVDIRKEIKGTKKVIYATLKAKLGTRRYEFLKTQLDRAGLFLMAAGDGNFIIFRPTAKQEPVARLVRQRGVSLKPGSILRHSFRADTSRRHTKCIVYGHGGGRNFGRSKNRGEFVDEQFSAVLGGEDAQVLVIHDNDAKTPKQAEFLARRRIAEDNRDANELTYTLAGHSAPGYNGGSIVWAPDTVVEVEDYELGIRGIRYVESVTMNRAPQTTTTIRLMRPNDLVFGENLF